MAPLSRALCIAPLFALPLSAGPATDVHRKLSAPFALPLGGVTAFTLTPDGRRALYLADPDAPGRVELFSARVDGSAPPARLSGPFTSSVAPRAFDFSPDGRLVLFAKDAGATRELYSVAVDGSAPPVWLASASGLLLDSISADSTTVVFRSRVGAVDRVQRVPIAGGAVSTLDAPLSGESAEGFALAPDGANVVWSTRQGTTYRLHRARVDGSAAPVSLGTWSSPALEQLELLGVTPSGRAIVATRDGAQHAFLSVATGAPAAPLSLHAEGAAEALPTAALSPDGTRLVFQLPSDGSSPLPQPPTPLRSVPTDGSAPAVTLHPDAVADFAFAPGARLVFRDGDLFVAPLDASAPATTLVAVASGGAVQSFVLSPDGARAVYLADQDTLGVRELYSVLLAGGAPAKLSPPIAAPQGGVRAYVLDAASSHACFWADALSYFSFDVLRAPLDGSGPAAVVASGVALPEGGPRHGDGRIVFRSLEAPDLLALPDDGSAPPQRLNAPFASGASRGDVTDFVVSRSGRLALYRADALRDERFELFAARLDRDEPARMLTASALFDSVSRTPPLLTPDESRAVGIASTGAAGSPQLFAVPTDGSAPPALLSELADGGVTGTPPPALAGDGSTVLYVAAGQLYRVPADGGAARARVSLPLPPGGGVQGFALAGTRVLYRADQGADQVFELFSAPLDGGAPPVRVSGPLVANGDVLEYRVGVAGLRVAYRADQDADERFELYSARCDGGSAPIRLSQALPAAGDVDDLFALTRLGGRVVYRARVGAERDLFAVPLLGGAAPVRLDGALTSDVGAPSASPDSTRAVFLAGGRLWSAAIAGGAEPVPLSAPLPAGEAIRQHAISPSSTRVLYVAAQRAPGVPELFAVPITGGPALALNAPLVAGGGVRQARFSPDGAAVLYGADQELAGREELYLARADGAGLVRKLNRPLAPGGDVTVFALGADGGCVVYLADEEQDDVFELFVTRLERGFARARR